MKKKKIKNYKIFVPLIMMVLMVIFFSVKSEYFLTASNFVNILREASTVGIVGVGVAVVLAGGDIDLSTGSIVGMLSMICAIFIEKFHFVTALTVPAVILIGALCGLLNAAIIEKLKLNSFIVTIAMQNVYKGIQVLVAFRDQKGNVFTQAITNRVFLSLGKGIGNIYYVIIIFILLVVLVQIILKMTKFGINVYAVGSSRIAATLSGVKCTFIRCVSFAICGACCGLAAVMMVARNGAATASSGTGLEFDALCAVIVGGAAMMPGAGGDTSALAPLVGAVFIEMLMNGIYKINMPAAYQTIFRGGALILMIVIDAAFIRVKARRSAKTAKILPEGGAV